MLDSPLVTDIIKLAIEEDLATGDITSELTIPPGHMSRAEFIAKEDLVVCGMPLLQKLFNELGYPFKFDVIAKDGTFVQKPSVIATLRGETRQILAAERLALNFLQHLSGIATLTYKVISKAEKIKILDTRKTTPGLRLLEKYAVKTGGGENHRLSLGDMVLVKNNHIDAHGNLQKLLDDLYAKKPKGIEVEIEVRNMEELEIVMRKKPKFVMLDNMNDTQVKEALAYIRKESKETLVEVSGGVTEERLSKLSALGVDFVSVGMLTNKAQSVDISLSVKTMA